MSEPSAWTSALSDPGINKQIERTNAFFLKQMNENCGWSEPQEAAEVFSLDAALQTTRAYIEREGCSVAMQK